LLKVSFKAFRNDISRNDLPTMMIHGDDDRILPADVTSRRQAQMIKGVKYIETKGGSHGLTEKLAPPARYIGLSADWGRARRSVDSAI
jgi:pimeloyl-ACP methyl ester carboxylesterase